MKHPGIPTHLLSTAIAAIVALATRNSQAFAPISPSFVAKPHSKLNMFTGIVEEMGKVVSLETKDDMLLWDGSRGKGTEMVVQGDVVMDGAYLGCSISVNGVCLTATELDFDNNIFKVGLAPETLRKTNLGNYATNAKSSDADAVDETKLLVNLERASEIGGRNSGHFVQGHVDNVGTIIDRWIDDNSLFFKISFPHEYMRYIVPKGFVAIDGTSLTVCDVRSDGPGGENWFTFMLVEYTQKKIIIPYKDVGDTVNIEVDVLGKYSERAWEAFVPKMEALQEKVESMERRLKELESDRDSKLGEVIPGEFIKKGSPPDDFSSKWDAPRRSAKWIRPSDDPNMEWVTIHGG